MIVEVDLKGKILAMLPHFYDSVKWNHKFNDNQGVVP